MLARPDCDNISRLGVQRFRDDLGDDQDKRSLAVCTQQQRTTGQHAQQTGALLGLAALSVQQLCNHTHH